MTFLADRQESTEMYEEMGREDFLDWMWSVVTYHELEAYRAGQEEMREKVARLLENRSESEQRLVMNSNFQAGSLSIANALASCAEAIRALPIKDGE